MAGRYIINQTSGKRTIILDEDAEKIEGGYFDTDGEWKELSGPLNDPIKPGYTINQTGGKRIILLEEDANEIGGGYFDEEGTWYTFGKKWDIEWDYSMGLPEDNGIIKQTTGTTSITMTDDGLKISGNNGSLTTYRFGPDPYQNTVGTLEADFILHVNGSNSSLNNFIATIGNDDNGVRLNTSQGQFRLQTSTTAGSGTAIAAAVNDQEYLMRLELANGEYKVYINDSLVSSGEASGMYYATSTNLAIHNVIGSGGWYVLLKSMKFKARVDA